MSPSKSRLFMHSNIFWGCLLHTRHCCMYLGYSRKPRSTQETLHWELTEYKEIYHASAMLSALEETRQHTGLRECS